ncbi:MAG: DegT/DnrJ/EryC1/StrS aminotransferase family protein [Methanomicrobiales archaeon]|nr:DegT/DnrJ/EryC1/StrS aminotransferase family protein [Methanomicrobiales archaeon]
MIPLAKPTITDDDTRAVRVVLESGNIATGSVVKEFEGRFSEYIGKKHAIAVNSGTIALYLAVRVLGLHRVILPAITCPEVLNAVVHAGAEPVIVDVEESTHNLDPDQLRGDRVRGADAVIITHCYGHPARMDEIRDTCREEGWTLVEDFAQSTGAVYRGKRCGSLGTISVTSFYATKSLTTGHGGMILTDSDETERLLRIARGDDAYQYLENFAPLNLKMTDFQAAMGIRQLGRLEEFVERRSRVASMYRDRLKDVEGITLLQERDGVRNCYYKVVAMVSGTSKETFISRMRERGVHIGIGYDPPLHLTRIMTSRGRTAGHLPVAERCAAEGVSLPVFPSMSREDVDRVCGAVREVLR